MRPPHLGGGLAPQRLLLGPLRRRPLLQHRLVVEVELRRLAGLAAEEVDRPVADDAQQPGADAAAGGVEAGAAAPDRDEGLLGHFLGGGAVADDPVGERVGGAAVAVVEDLERLGVLAADEGHQLLVGQSLRLLSPYRHRRSSPSATRFLGEERFDRLQDLLFVERRVEGRGRRFFVVLQPDRRRVARLDLDDRRRPRASTSLDLIIGAAPL